MIFRRILSLVSLLAFISLAGCMSAPSGLNLSLDRPTVQDKYLVEVHSLADPIRINAMHAWEIRLRLPSGEPVSGAKFEVDGGMPQHGHGFPTHPRVTRELGNGRYLLEGMKFSMPGWWELKLKIASTAGTDNVTFNTVISPALASSQAAMSAGSAF